MNAKGYALRAVCGVTSGLALLSAPMLAGAATFSSGSYVPSNAGTNVISAGGSYLLQPVVDYIYGTTALMQMLFAFLALAVVFVIGTFLWRAIRGWFNRHKR